MTAGFRTFRATVQYHGTVTGHQLKVYNSLGRRIEDFTPSADVVGLYSCGPTVYYFPHLGNMRAYVFADTLRRALRWKQIPVRHVINITDVGHAVADSDTGEDKLEVAAARERRTVADIADFYTQRVLRRHGRAEHPARRPLPARQRVRRADDRVRDPACRSAGVTYQIPSGLYFDTSKSPGYGTLALMDIAGQREAARVEQVEGRRNKTDFALWRAEEPGVRRVMRWDSPWGWGAPGWHLECSVMSMELLGQHFDLHTGGIDHRELHHVNEIAQSEAYLDDGEPWVKYWMHNEFLLLNNAKIAKSSGPVPRLADLVEDGYHPMAYRLFLLGGHYRSQLDFTTAAVDGAQTSLRRLVARIEPLRPLPPSRPTSRRARRSPRSAWWPTASPATRPRWLTWTRSTRPSPSTWPPRGCSPSSRSHSATRDHPGRPARHRGRGRRPARPAPGRPGPRRP